MIRVLHIITDLNVAGAQTVLMNYVRYLHGDPDVKIILCVESRSPNVVYENECKKLGVEVFFLNYRPFYKIPLISSALNWFRLQKMYYTVIKKVKPDIVHTHVTPILFYTLFPTIIAKIKVMVHTLHSDPDAIGPFFSLWAKVAFNWFKVYPVCVTPIQANKAVYKYRIKKYSIINNGINIKQYSSVSKNKIRDELGIRPETFVIGCVGRFSKIKNHIFLLKIFASYLKHNKDALLMLIGDGEEKERIIDTAKRLGILNKILFTGVRNDVNRIYSAMDLFMLTSFFESNSIVTVEAQAAGIRCLVADSIPDSVVLTNLVNRIPLASPIEDWVLGILGKIQKDEQRGILEDFSIEKTIRDLKKLYFNLYKNEKNI